jgi:hypothetical protein
VSDKEAMVGKYVASWHMPDPELRRQAIAEVWDEAGVYRNAGAEFHGHKGVEEAVTEAYEAFVKKGFVFQVAKVDVNHDAVRYVWEMRPAAGGEPDSVGTHVAMVGPDGRMVQDHQVVDKAPSGWSPLPDGQ